MEEQEIKKIKCKIFQAKNKEIEKLTKEINVVKQVKRKAQLAEKLDEVVDVLLSCEKFDAKSMECTICHVISNLRKRTAALILKAKNLDTT